MGKRNQHTFKKGHKVPNEVRKKCSLAMKGRILKDQPVVHHINGNHEDNRPENRMILTRSEHALIHQLQGDVGFQKGNISPNKGKHIVHSGTFKKGHKTNLGKHWRRLR